MSRCGLRSLLGSPYFQLFLQRESWERRFQLCQLDIRLPSRGNRTSFFEFTVSMTGLPEALYQSCICTCKGETRQSRGEETRLPTSPILDTGGVKECVAGIDNVGGLPEGVVPVLRLIRRPQSLWHHSHPPYIFRSNLRYVGAKVEYR